MTTQATKPTRLVTRQQRIDRAINHLEKLLQPRRIDRAIHHLEKLLQLRGELRRGDIFRRDQVRSL